jgi:hypothetical protein
MNFTDRERQAITSKHNLTEQEKKVKIKELDLEVWTAFVPKVKAHEKIKNAYWCSCPHCEKGKKKGTHNLTGLVYEHANGDGLGFVCKACGTKHPRVFELLGGAGSAAAEEYAWNRFEIDAVGQGWYCPHPQRWKEISKKVSENRAAKFKAETDRRKRENQIAYALREQKALEAAEPRTPSRPKGSCGVSKEEAERERERFASRPVRRSQGS